MRNSTAGIAGLTILALLGQAQAHVSLAEKNALPGSRYVAHFRVGHGCDGSPTTTLTIQLPPGVTQVAPEAPPGWSLATVREGGRVISVTWKGGVVPPGQTGEFVVTMTLPRSVSPLLFPATQICQKGEEHWTEPPSEGAKHPAPLLNLAAAANPAGLSLRDGWFRFLPAGLPAGGYFTLRNDSRSKLVLTGAHSPACGMLMLHKSQTGGGMASMDMVGAVDVPAGGSLVFAPVGYHLMCTDAKPVLKPGGQVPVTLEFQDGATLTADFAVRNAAGK